MASFCCFSLSFGLLIQVQYIQYVDRYILYVPT